MRLSQRANNGDIPNRGLPAWHGPNLSPLGRLLPYLIKSESYLIAVWYDCRAQGSPDDVVYVVYLISDHRAPQ